MIRRFLIAVVLVAGLLAPARADEPSEYAVKAAFLLNFARFVEWPVHAFEDEDDPIVIGVLGPDPFDSLLESTVADKLVNGRRVRVERFERAPRRHRCHVLFVARDFDGDVAALDRALAPEPILTVSDREGFLADGGMIRLVVIDDTVRFEVARGAAEAAGLRMSSRLLAVAHAVRGAP